MSVFTSITNAMMNTATNLLFLLLVGAVVGAASGFLGSFMVLKRMSLVGDALSHVALPGIAIAIMLGIDPMLGALVLLTLAVVGIWYLGEKSDVYPEALVGVFFTTSLAIGILITPETELFESLFGNIENVGYIDGAMAIVGALVIFLVTAKISRQLLLGIISEDLARSQGIRMPIINLIYLLLVGLVVALGVKFVGTILTGALVIIPAAAAKNLARSNKSFHLGASFIGVFSALIGILVSKYFGISSGPPVVLMSTLFFIASYIFRKD
jgi:ABC-type Mn2+/Zn2+ transport system permease subunit